MWTDAKEEGTRERENERIKGSRERKRERCDEVIEWKTEMLMRECAVGK